jgi:hypothetical protein
VWVIDKLEGGLALGRTYHKAAGLKLGEMDDGSCSATIFTLTGQRSMAVKHTRQPHVRREKIKAKSTT